MDSCNNCILYSIVRGLSAMSRAHCHLLLVFSLSLEQYSLCASQIVGPISPSPKA